MKNVLPVSAVRRRKMEKSDSPKSGFQLGFTGTLIVLLITAIAGTGFAVGLLLMAWLALGGLYSGFLLFLTGFSGLVTLIGILILRFGKADSS
jgi:hypothetical protein